MVHLRDCVMVLSCLLWASACRSQTAPTAVQTKPAGIDPTSMSPQAIIQESLLMDALRALPTRRAANADEENTKGLIATETLITTRLTAMGLTPTLETFHWKPPAKPDAKDETADAREWHNIIVEFPGTGSTPPQLPTRDDPPNPARVIHEVILIGAHIDAVPNAPGADDNGSGVAALLELARSFQALHAAGWTHERTIRLAFFNLEEVGLIGSSHHAKQWSLAQIKPVAPREDPAQKVSKQTPQEIETISLMLSLECLGFFSDAPNSQHSPFKPIPNVFEPPTVADNIVLVTIAKHQAISKALSDAMLKAAPTLKIFRADFSPLPLPDLMRSDHAPFMFLGIPSFMVTDTANFRNPNYHMPTDTVDTIDAKRLTLVAQAIAGAAWQLAQPAPPQKH